MSTEHHAVQSPTGGRTLEYALVDVFAERALEGNMLAIFADGRSLSTPQMQALARAMNLAETVFLLPPDATPEAAEYETRNGVRMRIFTVEEELPFAGHPTLGTASWLHWNHPRLRGAQTIVLSQNNGPIRVDFRIPGSAEIPAPGIFATMRQRDPAFGAVFPARSLAGLLGVPEKALDPDLPAQIVSTGVDFCVVPFCTVSALGCLAVQQGPARAWLQAAGAKFFYCIAPGEDGSPADFRARMQFYNGEDPATGSGCGCAIAYLVRHGIVPPGQRVLFEQGVEIARPSWLHASAGTSGPRVVDVFVGGRTIPVATGRFFLP